LCAIVFALDDFPKIGDNPVVVVLSPANAFNSSARRILFSGDVEYCIVLLASCKFEGLGYLTAAVADI